MACSGCHEPGTSYLYLLRNRLWYLYGSAGSIYRSGKNVTHALYQPAAGMASALHIYIATEHVWAFIRYSGGM